MVVDVFTYNGESDLLELRLNILDSVVDQFIICEAPTTFADKEKPMYFPLEQARFSKWKDKIKYFVIDENWTDEELMQADQSPNTQAPNIMGHARWMQEFLQKEAIKKSLTHLKDDDLCFIGDVDEIWDSALISSDFDSNRVMKLKLKVYSYYLNMRSNEQFCGPIRAKYKDIKNECLNHLRNNGPNNTNEEYGWHFTNQGGLEAVQKKISDQYNKEVFNDSLSQYLPERFGKTDYIGRSFEFKVDESQWPQFLKDNREKYDRLLYRSN